MVKGQLVVDLGSGGNPARDADILVEKHLQDNSQRGETNFKKFQDQEVIEADVHNLNMFEDNEIDVLVACHVLEHLERPNVALREWERVAKKGYIEVPNRKFDMWIRNREDTHLWYCQRAGNGIRLTPRGKVIPIVPNNSIMTRTLYRIFNTIGDHPLCLWWKDYIPIRARGTVSRD